MSVEKSSSEKFGPPEPGISPEAERLEREEQEIIDKNIEAAHAAEKRFAPSYGIERRADNLDYVSVTPVPEGTPKEWHKRLGDLITNAKGKLYEVGAGMKEKTKEKFEWWKSSEEHLIRRNEELDAQAEKVGGVERKFREWGEKYNKLNWKSKLAVGAGLGVGAVVTAGSIAVALPLLGIAAQRIAGLSTMYLKYEKNSHDEAWGKNTEWGKQKAMLKAGVYTVLMGLAIKEAIEYASETKVAHAAQAKVEEWEHKAQEKVNEWLGNMLGHHPAGTHAGPTVAGGISAMPESVPSEVSPASVVEAAVPERTIEIPVSLSIKATKGYGVEYMTKQLWKQLQDLHLDPSQYAKEDGDIYELINADEKTIDSVVHKIAIKHEFFKPDGTSVLIDPNMNVSFDDNGNIRLGREAQMPEYHVGGGGLEKETIIPHGKIETVDMTPFQHPAEEVIPAPTTPPPDDNSIWRDGQGNPITTSEGELIRTGTHVSPLGESLIPQVPEPPPAVEGIVVNKFGLEIQAAQPHIYADDSMKELFVYGGSPAEQVRVAREYLAAHPGGFVYGTDQSGNYRVRLFLSGGKLAIGTPERTSGFLGLFSSWAKPPSPDEFKSVIQ